MPVYFTSVEHVRTNYPFPTRIKWVPNAQAPLAPKEIQTLCRDIDRTNQALESFYLQIADNPQEFQHQFADLFRIAILGLRGSDAGQGPTPDETTVASEDLTALQTALVQVTGRAQTAVGKSLFRVGLMIFIPCIVAGAVLDLFWHLEYGSDILAQFVASPGFSAAKDIAAKLPPDTEANRQLIANVQSLVDSEHKARIAFWKSVIAIVASIFWIPAGAVFGNCIVHIAKSTDSTIDGLLIIDFLRFRPALAHLYVIVFGYGLLAVLAFKILQLGLFGVLLNDFLTTEPAISFVTGMATAIGFTAVRDILLSLKITRRD